MTAHLISASNSYGEMLNSMVNIPDRNDIHYLHAQILDFVKQGVDKRVERLIVIFIHLVRNFILCPDN